MIKNEESGASEMENGNASGIRPEDGAKKERRKPQTVILSDRSLLTVTLVENVVSFDDTNIILKTALGTVSVDGCDLHILKLDLDGGEIAVEGSLSGFYFLQEEESRRSGGKLGRFFR